jgi:hypothetical protein
MYRPVAAGTRRGQMEAPDLRVRRRAARALTLAIPLVVPAGMRVLFPMLARRLGARRGYLTGTGLVRRWLGVAGVVAAVIFLLGSIFSVLGQTPEESSPLVGVGLFIVWMLALSAALWRAASTTTTPRP